MKDGFLFIDKDSGWTSRDVCNYIGKKLVYKKVGHIGTLDPFATGLLILCFNNGTKAGTFIREANKKYIATLKLGKCTNTGDLTGEVIQEKDIIPFDKEDIERVFLSLLGEQEQIPPMMSAIKVHGVRLYDLARQGQNIDRKARKIVINSLELLSFSSDEITFLCDVSKGTYIRVLGEDIAKKLNNIGHLSSLRRISIDQYDISLAKKINEVTNENMTSISALLKTQMPFIHLDDEIIKKVVYGQKLTHDILPFEDDKVLILDKNDTAVAVYQKGEDGLFSCLRGLW